MLQQTQVATVIPYYERWMRAFPTVESLAAADPEDVLAHWAGLGYYRRCRLLQEGAKFVVEHGLPQSEREWRLVPGVGRYTAGAIASIAQHQPVPLVDGNVERVYARKKGDRSSGKALLDHAWKWAEEVIWAADPGSWNQALMELGATICKPVAPNCPACPIKGWCFAFQKGVQGELPTPPSKPAIRAEFHTCWVIYCNGRFGIERIPPGQWWQGMWQFPRLVHPKGEDPQIPFPSLSEEWAESVGTVRHSVTVHRISL